MKLNNHILIQMIQEEFQKIQERAYAYGTMSLPSGQPTSPCPQGSKQIGFLEKTDEEGKPLPRCVATDDGREINLEEEDDGEKTFQQKLKPRLHKQMKLLLRHGKNKTKAKPFGQKAPIDYRGSAPPGASGG